MRCIRKDKEGTHILNLKGEDLMKLRLTQRNIELITFIGKYKKIKAID